MVTQTTDKNNKLTDEMALRQTALDYVEGQYQGDADRIRRCLHPSLVKHALMSDSPTGRFYLNYLTQEEIFVATEDGGGTHIPRKKQAYEITILDIYEEIASVRADNPDWIDYLHMVKLNGEWVIANVLYTENRNKSLANPVE